MGQNKEKINLFLESMTLGTQYKILEEGKDKDELKEVAEKFGLVVPSRDFAVFKGMYAFIDKENLNGCTLPKEEVEKALPTLRGKAVDFDHYRKNVVGFWLEGKIVKDQIISYGVFHKSNFAEDFDIITELFDEGNLKISFEAWGNKISTGANSYDLVNIEFAGGALLIKTKPAAGERAEVLEMAKKQPKVLEYASTMTAPREYFRDSADTKKLGQERKALEVARFSIWDMQCIMRLIEEVGNPNDKEDFGYHDILSIDFMEGVVKTQWYSFDDSDNNALYTIYLTPRVESASYRERAVKEVKLDKFLKSSQSEDDSKDKKELNVSEENITMEKELKELQSELALIKAQKEISDKEIVTLKEKVEASDKKITELTSELSAEKAKVTESEKKLVDAKTQADTEKAEAIEKAKEETKKLTERKAELGEEFAKDMTDEQILNDDKFENAKLKKENSELKKSKGKENASTTQKKETTLAVGAQGTESDTQKLRKKMLSLAFGETIESEE